MSVRSTITQITPLPPYVSREAVLELLHDHSTIITLNPVVTHHGRCKPPSHALPEEHSSAWYEITDKIEYLPGTNITGSVTYTACMHNIPSGLQTHIHAPAGLEMRGKWQVLGWLPGEKRNVPEIGPLQSIIPKEGLYLREDCDMKCNVLLTRLVKKNLLKSHKSLVKRLLEVTRHQERLLQPKPAFEYSESTPEEYPVTTQFNRQRQQADLEW